MNNTMILLERVRAVSEPQSKNEVARRCNISESAIRGMYNGKRYPNALQCIEISKILRIDLGAILSYIAEDKARSAHTKAEARSKAPRLHPALGLALTIAAGLMLPGYKEAHASALNGIENVVNNRSADYHFYTLCEVIRLGGEGKTVEADETYLGKSPKTRKTGPKYAKPAPQVFSLVDRTGNIRSMYMDHKNVRHTLMQHIHEDSRLVTDGANYYKFTGLKHESVDHSKFEFVRGDVHTNTLEGFFSIFKRGLVGVYQHMDKKHLDRYLAEFDFRQNTRAKLGINDKMRADIALQGAKGKRLMYKTSH